MMNTRIMFGQLLAATALSAITVEGPWTGYDWVDEDNQIMVINGEVMGTNDEAQRRIDAPKPVDGDVADYSEPDNVILLSSFFTEETFDELFPLDTRNAFYTYDGFM